MDIPSSEKILSKCHLLGQQRGSLQSDYELFWRQIHEIASFYKHPVPEYMANESSLQEKT